MPQTPAPGHSDFFYSARHSHLESEFSQLATWLLLLLWQLQLPVAATCSCTLHDTAAAAPAPAPRKGTARKMHGAPHLMPMAMAGMLHDGASNHAAWHGSSDCQLAATNHGTSFHSWEVHFGAPISIYNLQPAHMRKEGHFHHHHWQLCVLVLRLRSLQATGF